MDPIEIFLLWTLGGLILYLVAYRIWRSRIDAPSTRDTIRDLRAQVRQLEAQLRRCEAEKDDASSWAKDAGPQQPDGFYWVSKADGSERCLVKLYTHPDTGERGIGYGYWDGAGFLPLRDLVEDAVLVPAPLGPTTTTPTPLAAQEGSGTPPSEMFEDAFASPCSGIRRSCECGREFYDISEGNSSNWEDGEWADLQAREDGERVIGRGHSIGCYVISGREYVIGCPCNAGGPAERWILENADSIARYLNARAKALRAKADRIEVQNPQPSDTCSHNAHP